MANSEKSASWYDEAFKKELREKGWKKPELIPRHVYAIAELNRLEAKTILDIGCGKGGFLSLCRDNGFICYGFDFSPVAIEICKKYNKLENVWIGNALDKENYMGEYDAYLAIQVLEHITQDLDVIRNLKPDIPFIFSLPTWAHPGTEHVRKFPSDESISQRYGEIVDIKSIKTFGNRRRLVVSMTKRQNDKGKDDKENKE